MCRVLVRILLAHAENLHGEFDSPRNVGVDSAGNVYVADRLNDRIQKFDNDGEFLAAWGMTGTDDGEFDQPAGVAGDAFGNVYVADSVNHRVQKFFCP